MSLRKPNDDVKICPEEDSGAEGCLLLCVTVVAPGVLDDTMGRYLFGYSGLKVNTTESDKIIDNAP